MIDLFKLFIKYPLFSQSIFIISVILIILLFISVYKKKISKKYGVISLFILILINLLLILTTMFVKNDYEIGLNEVINKQKEGFSCKFNKNINISDINPVTCTFELQEGTIDLTYDVKKEAIIDNNFDFLINSFKNDFENYFKTFIQEEYMDKLNQYLDEKDLPLVNDIISDTNILVINEFETNDLKNYTKDIIKEKILMDTNEITIEINDEDIISTEIKAKIVEEIKNFFTNEKLYYTYHVNINDKFNFYNKTFQIYE